jgi:chorismate mutase
MKMRTRAKFLLSATTVTLAVTGGVANATPCPTTNASLTTLVNDSADRILLADKVAAAKFGTTQPIDDPAREKVVLDAAQTEATTIGADPVLVNAVFKDQIEANKQVQRALYDEWTADPKLAPTTRPDLATEVRPIINKINTALVADVKGATSVRGSFACNWLLAETLVSVDHAKKLSPAHSYSLAYSLRSFCG